MYKPVSEEFLRSRAFAREVEYTLSRGTQQLQEVRSRLRELVEDFEANGDPGDHAHQMKDIIGTLNILIGRMSLEAGSWNGYATARNS